MNIEEIIFFLNDTEEITNNYNDAIEEQKAKTGLNIFQLISNIYHRENLHSDIIKFLLDPKEKHKQGDRYLQLFMQFLKQIAPELSIDKENYRKPNTTREEPTYKEDSPERGFIDILVKDQESGRAIVIENKIYNADDMLNQIPKYINSDLVGGIEKVDAVAYISLDGHKTPVENWIVSNDEERKSIRKKIIKVAAYNYNDENNLVNGWLNKAIDNTINNDDCKFIIKHYRDLLIKLRNTMETLPEARTFYDKLYNDPQDKYYDISNSVITLLNKIGPYLAERFLSIYNENKF